MNEYVCDMLCRVLKSNPKMTLDQVHPDGDIIFSTKIAEMGLDPQELAHPIFRTRFFVNFIGEMLVRSNVDFFANILTGLDPTLYEKILYRSKHTDFGMYVDNKEYGAKWQMHISFVQQILTEDMERTMEEDPAEINMPMHGDGPTKDDDINSEEE